MSKYTAEDKMKAVKMAIEENASFGDISRETGINKGDIQKWVAAYKVHGISGVVRERVSYPGEFKQMVIEDMNTNKLSLRQTAIKYNIGTHAVVAKWERIYLEKGPEGLYEERRGRARSTEGASKAKTPALGKKAEEDLIAEVQRLRAENAYLKKLNALVHEQELREKKHKRSGS